MSFQVILYSKGMVSSLAKTTVVVLTLALFGTATADYSEFTTDKGID